MDKLIIEKKTIYDEKSNSLIPSKNEYEIKRLITVNGREEKSTVATFNSLKDTITFNPVEMIIKRQELNEIHKLVHNTVLRNKLKEVMLKKQGGLER